MYVPVPEPMSPLPERGKGEGVFLVRGTWRDPWDKRFIPLVEVEMEAISGELEWSQDGPN